MRRFKNKYHSTKMPSGLKVTVRPLDEDKLGKVKRAAEAKLYPENDRRGNPHRLSNLSVLCGRLGREPLYLILNLVFGDPEDVCQTVDKLGFDVLRTSVLLVVYRGRAYLNFKRRSGEEVEAQNIIDAIRLNASPSIAALMRPDSQNALERTEPNVGGKKP
jgi:hypothetical protein